MFFAAKEEKIFWERWVLPLHTMSDRDRPTINSGMLIIGN
jgi:hypothetical protein